MSNVAIQADSFKPYVLYSDLNCPFCFILNEWIIARNVDEWIEWIGIEHLPDLTPIQSCSIESFKVLQKEVQEVLLRSEGVHIIQPEFRANTRLALKAIEAVKDQAPQRYRDIKTALFRALWIRGQDISDVNIINKIMKSFHVSFSSEELDRYSDIVNLNTENWKSKYDRIPYIVGPGEQFYAGLGSGNNLNEYLEKQNLTLQSPFACLKSREKDFSVNKAIRLETRIKELIEIVRHEQSPCVLLNHAFKILYSNGLFLELFNYEEPKVNYCIKDILGRETCDAMLTSRAKELKFDGTLLISDDEEKYISLHVKVLDEIGYLLSFK
ncbi:MAG: DsbA family protein [Bdellovibrionota bacterium]